MFTVYSESIACGEFWLSAGRKAAGSQARCVSLAEAIAIAGRSAILTRIATEVLLSDFLVTRRMSPHVDSYMDVAQAGSPFRETSA